MARATTATAAEILECRAARLFNRQGSFVRRRVDLNRRFAPSKLTITDLDLLVIDFGSDLHPTRTNVECKTGGAPKELDRMIWLAGLTKLTGAERAALFISGTASGKSRQIGRDLDVLLQDEADLARREASLRIDRNPNWGSHDPLLVANEAQVHHVARQAAGEMERAYWFLRSEFWHLPPSLAIKRSIAVVEALSRLLVPGLPEPEATALSWLLGDTVTTFSVAAVELAGNALVMPSDNFHRFMSERLAEGIASYAQLERLSEIVDRYLASMLDRAGVKKADTMRALGALAPTPPTYADALIEVIERISERPRAARHLPLASDAIVAEATKGVLSVGTVALLPIDSLSETLSLVRLCVAFLRRQAGLAPTVAEAIERATNGTGGAIPSHTGSPADGNQAIPPTSGFGPPLHEEDLGLQPSLTPMKTPRDSPGG